MHPCAGSPRCSSATFTAAWPGTRPGGRKWSGWVPPRALPWHVSTNRVPTSWARSFPQPRSPAGTAQPGGIRGPRAQGPVAARSRVARCLVPRPPLRPVALHFGCDRGRAAAGPAPRRSALGRRCDRRLSPAPRTRTQPAAACWCSARIARRPSGWAGATPRPARRPAIRWRPRSTSCAA